MKPVRNKPPPPPRKTPAKIHAAAKDPVKVFCRLRPLQNGEEPCVKVISQTTVSLLKETGSAYHAANYKEIQHTFQHVFDDRATQKEVFDHVALPLVSNLIRGKNGLLFTYGVTGSGKTFTMTGDPQNGGIMPRCLDVIFNSIINYQAKKFVFKPDRMNRFDLQSDADARMDRQKELHSVTSLKTPKKKDSDTALPQWTSDSMKVEHMDEDNTYAVFVTYVEVYNNAVYDLLEDVTEDTLKSEQLQVKIVREDACHDMYVHSVTEMEVKSTEEAFEAFYKGQKRKRMAITTLNSKSSRSHSVFTIRLVQAPLDRQGENILQGKNAVCISQLSLVDLAGSERTNRTKNSGQRLRETGKINNSLMTLRTCLEILRENQLHGTNKMVPYRDSKITYLFKNYFDGKGEVRMIVCINPRFKDYDETVHVMKFAEMTQEIQMSQPVVTKLDFGLTPGRRKANQVFKQALHKMEENGSRKVQNIDVEIGLVYCLGPPFPCLELNEPGNDKLINDLATFLELRTKRKNLLLKDWKHKHEDFRKKLIEVERENVTAKLDVISLRAALEQERKKISALETRLMNSESDVMGLQYQLQQKEAYLVALKHEIEEKMAERFTTLSYAN